MSDNQESGLDPSQLGEIWRFKEVEINKAIDTITKYEGRNGVYIKSAHGSGKSASLLVHVLDRINEIDDANIRVIYVVAETIESEFVMDYIKKEQADDDMLIVCTHQKFIGDYLKSPLAFDKSIIMSDVPLRPSSSAVVFSSILLELLDKDTLTGYIFLAAHSSEVAIRTFQKACSDNFPVIEVPDANPVVPVTSLGDGGQPESVAADLISQLRAANPKSMVIFSMANDRDYFRYKIFPDSSLDRRTVRNRERMNLLQGDSHLVAIDDSAPSFPLPTLALVISSGKYQIKKWDTLSSQIVAMETLMTTADLERERSWVLKSGESVDRFYTLLTDQQVHHLEETGDPWCPAWNEDIMWTALSLLEVFPGRSFHKVPLPIVPDHFALSETMVRLDAMGAINDSRGSFSLSRLTKIALDIRHKVFSFGNAWTEIDLHNAMLFARASDDSLPLNVRRVLVRLAALIANDVDAIIRPRPGTEPSLEDLQGQCLGVGREQAHKGHLWIALGVWLKAHHEEAVMADEHLQSVCHDCLLFSSDKATMVHDLVQGLETFLNIPNIEYHEEVQATKLSDDEVLLVEQQLVLCYMTRVMTIQSRRNGTMYDAISGHPLTYREGELMNVEAFNIGQFNRGISLVFAIYLELKAVPGVEDHEAGKLIYIPPRAFKVVGRNRLMGWPDIVATSYPLH